MIRSITMEYGMKKFKLGKGYDPKQSASSAPPTPEALADAKPIEEDAFSRLRHRQRELGLLDENGNLYDPKTHTWTSGNIRTEVDGKIESNIFDDLLYFEHYPKMAHSLPSYIPPAPDNSEEFAVEATVEAPVVDTQPDSRLSHSPHIIWQPNSNPSRTAGYVPPVEPRPDSVIQKPNDSPLQFDEKRGMYYHLKSRCL